MGVRNLWLLFSLEDANDEEMNSLITASQLNKNTRANCEKNFNELKQLVELDVRSIYCDVDEHVENVNSSKDVFNHLGSR